MKFTFQTPTRLIFGSGRLDALGDEKLPGKKALLLTSRGKSAERTGCPRAHHESARARRR